jgi:Arc/MetJ family transcription regulator
VVGRALRKETPRTESGPEGSSSQWEISCAAGSLATHAERRRFRLDARSKYTIQVYDTSMTRTNIDLNDDLLERVMRRFGVHTKTEAVDLALRQVAGQPMTIHEALAMRGAHALNDVVEDPSP